MIQSSERLTTLPPALRIQLLDTLPATPAGDPHSGMPESPAISRRPRRRSCINHVIRTQEHGGSQSHAGVLVAPQRREPALSGECPNPRRSIMVTPRSFKVRKCGVFCAGALVALALYPAPARAGMFA